MKYRNKHYYRTINLPVILLPVVALTIGLTVHFDHRKRQNTSYEPDMAAFSPVAEMPKIYENRLIDQSDGCEKALFSLTGDTVLIYTGPDFQDVPDGLRKILYKDLEGSLKTIDVPFSELRLVPDTSDTDDE